MGFVTEGEVSSYFRMSRALRRAGEERKGRAGRGKEEGRKGGREGEEGGGRREY